MKKEDLRYLKALSKEYPTVSAAATEIINLSAILSLPKGTEHFITDIHGEYDQFLHVLKNGSGAIRRKLDDEFGPDIRQAEKRELAALIYYPERKLEYVRSREANLKEWYQVTIYRLIRVCRSASSKYTRSKVRKAMAPEFAYIIEELINGNPEISDQEAYYNEIINSVIETERAGELITAFCNLIRRMVVDHLHVVGDIFDRGPYPNLVMDTLMKHHSLDIQWGNHDILWMGAAAGSLECIANVVRISARYGNLNTLEEAYGINFVPLAKFAMETYANDSCKLFKVKFREEEYDAKDAILDSKIQKAISIIQFKLEGQLIKRRPEYHMEDRLLLDKINPKTGKIKIGSKSYAMLDMDFPTIDWKDPYKLTPEEERVMRKLRTGFINSESLQRHVRFLYAKGNMYKIFNGNLLYHGCVLLNPDGSFREVEIYGKKVKGKAVFDLLEVYARKAYYSVDEKEKERGLDIMWAMWLSPNSPVFGKSKMATFERLFIAEKETHKEPKDPYYSLLEDEKVVNSILEEFGLNPEDGHIVNGHVPVEAKAGESPIKCNGKLLIIDGGFSKAYQDKTGIAGYTLIYNSYGMLIAAHDPIDSIDRAIKEGMDIQSHARVVRHVTSRKTVRDTDIGKGMIENVNDLKALLKAYREGVIAEH